MQPVYREDTTQKLQDLIYASEHPNNTSSEMWVEERKKQLIQKMKEDTDNKEYPIMLRALILVLSVLSLIHIFLHGAYIFGVVLIVGVIYYIFTTKKLKTAIQRLQENQNNTDQIIHDGYLIKDTRFTAVKFAFLLFFPIICFMGFRLIEDTTTTLPLWQYLATGIVISSIAWFVFFSDDQSYLEQLENEIKGLTAVSQQQETGL